MQSKTAFIFPGQGSQTVGMMANLPELDPIISETFSEASDTLGYDVWRLAQEGPLEKLNQTEYTQPVLLAAGVAVWRAWKKCGGRSPDFMAGHSLGEYTALVCAGALAFQTALKLVEKRGQFMQAAVPLGKGAMAAIVGLENDQVQAICKSCAQGEVLSPANFNSIGQVVIAGEKQAVQRAVEAAKSAEAKLVMLLSVSVPSHCELMRPAAENLTPFLNEVPFQVPTIPVVNNVEATLSLTPEDIKNALIHQLYSPVRWVEIVHYLTHQGVTTFIESGPGKVLTGLNKRIVPTLQHLSIVDTLSFQQTLPLFSSCLKK